MKYRVKTTCFWGGQYYKAGEEVTIEDSAKVPEHFQPVGAPGKAQQKKETAEAVADAKPATAKPRTRKGRGA